jgi:hypothetical protein
MTRKHRDKFITWLDDGEKVGVRINIDLFELLIRTGIITLGLTLLLVGMYGGPRLAVHLGLGLMLSTALVPRIR